MSAWKSFIEWYFGIAASGPGEGTRWEWIAKSLWPAGWPVWLALLVTAATMAGLLWSYRREGAQLSPGRRLLLMGLRFAAIAVALGLWTQPTLMVARSGLPSVVVLFDTSASMSLRDGDGSTALSQSTGLSAPRRWDRVLNAVTREDARFLRDLAERNPLRLYQFSTTSSPLSAGKSPAVLPATEAISSLKLLEPIGTSTRPAEGVRQILAELRGMPPAALIVLTDGIASESEADRLSTVADLVRRRGTSLFVVPVGTSEPTKDLQLFDVVMDEVAFVGDPVIVSGKLRATGLENRNATLRVTVEGESAPLAEQVVPMRDGEAATKFELSLSTAEPAELDLLIEVVPSPGESDLENNRERRHLSVRQERLNVLLLESAPRYEFRYLKQWLERDSSVVLQTLLVDADPEYAREDRTAVGYFPVQKEDLWRYDVVILGDVSPADFGGSAAEWLTEFVRDKGGGLLLVAGPRHNPQSFSGTPLESLLPFPFDAIDADAFSKSNTDEYRPRLTLDGQKGVPMFRFADNELASLETWNSLPGFYGLLPIQQLKPGVRVLAEHPYAPAKEGRLPVFLLQQIGAGKVLFHATDELWRWRFRTGDTYFGKYWGQAIRFLSRARILGKDRSAELLVDRQSYVVGEPVLLRVRFLDDRLAPTQNDGVAVVFERTGAGRREVTLSRLPYLPTVFEAQVTGLTEGTYHAWMARPSFEVAPPTTDFRIDSLQRETRRRAVDRTDLELAAKSSGGSLVELEDLSGLPARIPQGRLVPMEQGRSIPLWSRFEPLLLLIGLLTSEWILRRRWRLV